MSETRKSERTHCDHGTPVGRICDDCLRIALDFLARRERKP